MGYCAFNSDLENLMLSTEHFAATPGNVSKSSVGVNSGSWAFMAPDYAMHWLASPCFKPGTLDSESLASQNLHVSPFPFLQVVAA